ncbi:MAG: putative DNA-binding domain-containing protein [Bacteriovoracia bacterium]
MSRLIETQRWVKWAMTYQAPLTKLPARGPGNQSATDVVRAFRGGIPIDGLAVYQDGYFARLGDALKDDFECVHKLLGEQNFALLGMAYLDQHPSHSFTLGDIGADFIAFVTRHPLAEARPVLLDAARLCTAVNRTFYTPYLPRFNPARLGEVPAEAWASATLSLDPSVCVLESRWMLDRLWEARREAEPYSDAWLAPAETPGHYLIFRHDSTGQDHGGFPVVTRLLLAQARFLEEIARGASLGDACEAIDAAGETEIMEWFTAWVQTGVIRSVHFSH